MSDRSFVHQTHDTPSDRIAARALDLHEKAFMPLIQALELALSEAAPSPIWPCAKLVINNGQVSLLSHQYAPGLPDGEHDVYPKPTSSCVWPTRPLKLVQVTLPDGSSAALPPERAYFDSWSMQELENKLKPAAGATQPNEQNGLAA